MRCIVAGSRSYHGLSVGIIARAVAASGFRDQITEVVSGGAKGIDTLGEIWAKGQGIPVKRFPADWDKYGKRAGKIRNVIMAAYAAEINPESDEEISAGRGIGLLIAVHDSQSRGTAHMILAARKLGLRVFVGHPREVPVDEAPVERRGM